MTGIPVAIVDPGSLLARDVRDVLEKRGFPASAVHLFQTGSPDAGYLTEDGGEAAYVSPLAANGLEGCKIAFLCGDRRATERFLVTRSRDGCLAIDLTGARSGGPFLPQTRPGPIPDSPLYLLRNPAALVVAEAVQLVSELAPVAAVTAAVDRPVSELGKDAVDELFQQAIAIAAFRAVPRAVLGYQAVFNQSLPAGSDRFDAELEEDVSALAGRPLPVAALSMRGSLFHGTAIRLELRFDGPVPPAAAVRERLLGSPRFAGPDAAATAPGTLDVAGRDETLVLGVTSRAGSLRLCLAADHLRGPRAVLAVSVAEALVRERALLAGD